VLVTYTTDYVVPATYPEAPNGSPEVAERQGDWSTRALVSGTYLASLVAGKDLDFRFGNATTRYRSSSPAATRAVLVGDALEPTPYAPIPDATRCEACHQELAYHGGAYRGLEACLACHGAAGSEDQPRYVAANAPETRALSVAFRSLLHRVHRGRELSDPSFEVATAGTAPYPDNFGLARYDAFSTLPAFPSRTLECARCHGDDPAVLVPPERAHPDAPLVAVASWRPVCLGCHDDGPARAHVDSNTAFDGAEACAICHAPGEFADVGVAHAALREPR
jgi:OmcA/MtrC family decaheme c-type cytochrome